jgi:hypothetical protein
MWGQGGVYAGGGSDPALRAAASADAALVAPTPGLPLIQSGTRSGPELVPRPVQSRYLT